LNVWYLGNNQLPFTINIGAYIPKFMPVLLLYGVVLFLVISLLSANLLNGD